MAHKKHDDSLKDMLGTLISEIKTMKEEINELKNNKWQVIDSNEVPLELKDQNDINKMFKDLPTRETPYKVMTIQSVIQDESYVDPSLGWVKKIYTWLGKTFKNKEEAFAYVERMKSLNPWQQYDVFPV